MQLRKRKKEDGNKRYTIYLYYMQRININISSYSNVQKLFGIFMEATVSFFLLW